ncbi:hypothetical protein EYF80_042531 [Liparis tanakae]|uniref:Uncharacterized protein n=1 Tax=Liparis tanakae TaxID=230148 RepID=A0A4Z2G2G2_9TELE|nr:hypothetical protein EYF80_042531 [Liparis tanakae]
MSVSKTPDSRLAPRQRLHSENGVPSLAAAAASPEDSSAFLRAPGSGRYAPAPRGGRRHLCSKFPMFLPSTRTSSVMLLVLKIRGPIALSSSRKNSGGKRHERGASRSDIDELIIITTIIIITIIITIIIIIIIIITIITIMGVQDFKTHLHEQTYFFISV